MKATKIVFTFFLLFILVQACKQESPKVVSFLGEDQKKAAQQVVENFCKFYAAQDLKGLTQLLSKSPDFVFLGIDSAEVIKSIPDFEVQMKNNWLIIPSAKPGELRNLSIQGEGAFVAIQCEIPWEITAASQVSHPLFRFSCILKREDNSWRIVNGMMAIASKKQSSREMVKKMQEMGKK